MPHARENIETQEDKGASNITEKKGVSKNESFTK